jgi:P27 family predicted phage terminase small subunit
MGGPGSGRRPNPELQALKGKTTHRAKGKPVSKTGVIALHDDTLQKYITPVMPDFLIAEAKEHWKEVVPQWVAQNLVCAVDSVLIGQYCNYVGKAVRCEKTLAKYQSEFVRHTGNTFVKRPERKMADEYWTAASKLLKQLGLTPSERKKRGMRDLTEIQSEEIDGDSADSFDDPLLSPKRAR